jgi:multidrug efflux pump subunit AcrB
VRPLSGEADRAPAQPLASIESRRLNAPTLRAFLSQHGVAAEAPWDLRALDAGRVLLPPGARRTPSGTVVQLGQVVDVGETESQLELRREDFRQDIAVTARLEGRDLGSAMADIRRIFDNDPTLPPGTLEYGGLYQQQQESFRNLLTVLAMAIVLVFTVLLLEFRAFLEPLSIMFGATLALFGSIFALWITGTSLNVVSFLGAIIGVGIVAKNGILMLDLVDHFVAEGLSLHDALIRSGRRRLRPVLMTSMAAAVGMLPLAYGVGSGADMLRPLAIAVIGSLCVSVLLSLVATPAAYYVMRRER